MNALSKRHAALGALLLLASAASLAAGGHFDVDDAAVLDPGQCQVEVWAARVPADARSAVHFGSACRVGPVELGLNIDPVWQPGARGMVWGPQVKFVVAPLLPTLGAGIVWSVGFDSRGGRPVHAVYVPLTWLPAEAWKLHADAGVDAAADGTRTRRLGIAAEWAADATWSVTAERAKVQADWVSRLGVRATVNDSLSLDLSTARTGPQALRIHVIGLNQSFAR